MHNYNYACITIYIPLILKRKLSKINDLLTISNYLLNNYTQLLVIIFQIYFPMHLSPK